MTNGQFLRVVLGSFFKWWWAAITGVASIIGVLTFPAQIIVSKPGLVLLIFAFSLFLFLAVSTVIQGMMLARRDFEKAIVTEIVDSLEYGGEHIFVIDGLAASFKGKVVELRRVVNDIELPFALVEPVEINASGAFQSKLLWISPGHQNDLKKKRFSKRDVIVELQPSIDILEKWRGEGV